MWIPAITSHAAASHSTRVSPLPPPPVPQNGQLSERCAALTANISCLFNTAKMELQRKDDTIKELRERCVFCASFEVAAAGASRIKCCGKGSDVGMQLWRKGMAAPTSCGRGAWLLVCRSDLLSALLRLGLGLAAGCSVGRGTLPRMALQCSRPGRHSCGTTLVLFNTLASAELPPFAGVWQLLYIQHLLGEARDFEQDASLLSVFMPHR